MIVPNKKLEDAEEFMRKLDIDMKERRDVDFRIVRLRNQLKTMSHARESVQRSKNIERIGRFNNLFIAKIAELSKIMQTHGFSNRDDAAEIVRKAKAQ
jgi:hypothetical protein